MKGPFEMTPQPHQHEHDGTSLMLDTALSVIPGDMLSHVSGGDADPSPATATPVALVPPLPMFPGW